MYKDRMELDEQCQEVRQQEHWSPDSVLSSVPILEGGGGGGGGGTHFKSTNLPKGKFIKASTIKWYKTQSTFERS